jgi:hypothetical protein
MAGSISAHVVAVHIQDVADGRGIGVRSPDAVGTPASMSSFSSGISLEKRTVTAEWPDRQEGHTSRLLM